MRYMEKEWTEGKTKAPWLNFYGDTEKTLDYPDCTMFERVEQMAKQYPDYIALDFMGKKTTYKRLCHQIEICARALKAIGTRPGDRITICMPNCPQAIIMFYAVNLVGAIGNMIHPLSSEKEIEFYIKESESITAITLDQFYHKFEAIRQNVDLSNVIIASIKDELSQPISRLHAHRGTENQADSERCSGNPLELFYAFGRAIPLEIPCRKESKRSGCHFVQRRNNRRNQRHLSFQSEL